MWHKDEMVRKRSISPREYDVAWSKQLKWFGIIIPDEMRDICKEFFSMHHTEIPLIGFLVDPLGRIFFKATDIPNCYGYIENGEIDDFFSSDDDGGSSFCTLTTVKAALWESFWYKSSGREITEINAIRLVKWLMMFDRRLDRKLYPRHQMYRIGMTKDGKNAYRMVSDPSVPVLEKAE
jgi:hypothetical protein